MKTKRRISLKSTSDILNARLEARELAIHLGFTGAAVNLIAGAIAKVAKFVVAHCKGGEIVLDQLKHGARSGIRVTAHVKSPGRTGMPNGAPTSNGARHEFDIHAANVRSMMDELKVISDHSGDTTMIMKRWH